MFPSGVAAQEGSIREGDLVLSINGTTLCSYTHWEAVRVLRRAKTREMGVVVFRRGGMSSVCKKPAETNTPEQTQTQFNKTGERWSFTGVLKRHQSLCCSSLKGDTLSVCLFFCV